MNKTLPVEFAKPIQHKALLLFPIKHINTNTLQYEKRTYYPMSHYFRVNEDKLLLRLLIHLIAIEFYIQ